MGMSMIHAPNDKGETRAITCVCQAVMVTIGQNPLTRTGSAMLEEADTTVLLFFLKQEAMSLLYTSDMDAW